MVAESFLGRFLCNPSWNLVRELPFYYGNNRIQDIVTNVESYNLIAKEWGEERFLSSRNEWQKLLESSDADRFFMSWQWMSQWWINWGGRSSDDLYEQQSPNHIGDAEL